VRCFSKLSIVSASLNWLSMSVIWIPNALLPLDCLMTAACSLSYILFADSFGSITCCISSDRVPSMTPTAILFAVFHSFSSSRYVFSSSAVGCNKTGQWPTLFLTFPLHCGSHFITLHYSTLLGTFSLHYSTLLGMFSLLYSTCVRFMVAGGDLFVTPPLWHLASVTVQSLS